MKRIIKSIRNWLFPELEIVEFKIPEMSFILKGGSKRWHHYAITVSWWQKGPKKKEKMSDIALFKNGNLNLRMLIDNDGNRWTKKKEKK